MARLEMTLEFDKEKPTPKAEPMLKAARDGLALLRALERHKTGKRRATVPWQVDVVSSYSRCLIVYRCEGEGADALPPDTAGLVNNLVKMAGEGSFSDPAA